MGYKNALSFIKAHRMKPTSVMPWREMVCEKERLNNGNY